MPTHSLTVSLFSLSSSLFYYDDPATGGSQTQAASVVFPFELVPHHPLSNPLPCEPIYCCCSQQIPVLDSATPMPEFPCSSLPPSPPFSPKHPLSHPAALLFVCPTNRPIMTNYSWPSWPITTQFCPLLYHDFDLPRPVPAVLDPSRLTDNVIAPARCCFL
ncbi:hypothetical protein ASPFODRAFT_42011 [Aspergillus luchuensis CBS 106.47]|uniref:Uncharacterized protein n=1 Tax=Aspergillus luchuensis (strain CBS 106.47) TaxID=1137211 RepID=A0A1M3TQP4_ASPLC|nr:hypothetical protein ASPFODRAFT_42011 [Aspergillus luchuensis CBS 106.47]